jgi:hypothetical protein
MQCRDNRVLRRKGKTYSPIFYGIETPILTIEKINNIENQVNNQNRIPDKICLQDFVVKNV